MDSDDSDIFVEYQIKPVNKLTKRDGLKIKNRVLRQTKLTFERTPEKKEETLTGSGEISAKSPTEYSTAEKAKTDQNVRKSESSPAKKENVFQNTGKAARTRGRSSASCAKRRKSTTTASSQTESPPKTPQKTIVDYFSDSTPEKHTSQIDTQPGTSVGRISVRNDLVINFDVSITTGGDEEVNVRRIHTPEMTFTRVLPTAAPVIPLEVSFYEQNCQKDLSSPKTINDYFSILSESKSPTKTPKKLNISKHEKKLKSPTADNKSDDEIEVITLSPGIKRRKKRFKSILNITGSSSPSSPKKQKAEGEKVKRHLFAAPSLVAPSEPSTSSFAQNQASSSSLTACPTEELTDSKNIKFDGSDVTNHLDACILGVIIEDVMKHQLHLKEVAMICGTVHNSLITDFDMTVIEKFLCMDRNSQTLFMRMFFRKPGWHRVSSLTKYDELSDGLVNEIKALESVNLIDTGIEKESVRCQLGLLMSGELIKLSKNFSVPGGGTMRKEELLDALLTETRVQKSVMDLFKVNRNSSRLEMVGRETLKLLGPCFRIEPSCRQTLSRILLLFSLPHDIDEEAKRASSMRFLMHQVLTVNITFVPFDVIPVVIFQTRADFLEYESALQLRQEMEVAQQSKNHDAFTTTARKSREVFRRLLADEGFLDRVAKLPTFLRRYSAGAVCASVLTQFCEFCKKKNDTQEIIAVLLELLEQKMFGVGSRGKWYELLCQAYQSLGMSEEAADVILEASKDEFVDEVRTLTLQLKAERLLKAKKNRIQEGSRREALANFATYDIEEPTSIEINAQAVSGNMAGSRLVYVQHTTSGKRYSSVEEQAICYYKRNGFLEGCHAEGFIVSTIFYLFFFDLIYSKAAPGVFLSQYQERPLDMWSSSFFLNRRDGLSARLREMTTWSARDVADRIEDTFARYRGSSCVVTWNESFSPKTLCEIIDCIGMTALTAICERFVHKPRLARSGFPDLTLWNTQTRTCKFVEVKSPNDRLAPNQRVWLHYLRNKGIECEVCNVRNMAAKSLR